MSTQKKGSRHNSQIRASLPYAEHKPSQIKEVHWIYAFRKTGTYPLPTERNGKWLIFVGVSEVDATWIKIKRAVEDGRLGTNAKVSTALSNPNSASCDKVICVYTYDWTDENDVLRIREELRKIGINQKIPYKADVDTLQRKYSVNGNKNISKRYE